MGGYCLPMGGGSAYLLKPVVRAFLLLLGPSRRHRANIVSDEMSIGKSAPNSPLHVNNRFGARA